MDFSESIQRKREESIVPMINVVFLLLIFFLMTSQMTPAEPFEVDLPKASQSDDPVSELILHVSKDGAVQFEEFQDETAWVRLTGAIDEKTTIRLRVDQSLDAQKLAQVLKRLAPTGAVAAEIVTLPK